MLPTVRRVQSSMACPQPVERRRTPGLTCLWPAGGGKPSQLLPAVGTFKELDMPAPLLAPLRPEGGTVPFPILAATLPDALAGRDVLGTRADRFG